ncbi:CAP domain-containing protein [Sedimentitalea sp. CY04]|uniref:CAP domain-containing protein n=1 Tax=Parasedimentitalea denitrificans TaxID=2211118 RepID=A0ABX0W3C8_9RHOB|nr:CAP domain-containing protein [Sedimentitalea sp. CY04]
MVLISLLFWALPVSAADVDRSAATSSINALRSDRNLPELQYSKKLEKAARRHAEDMARNGFFSHTGSDGSGVGDRVRRSGYGWCTAAENIASGQPTLVDVMQSWTTSQGHRKNMLHKAVSEFALARGSGNIWVMVLARPGC